MRAHVRRLYLSEELLRTEGFTDVQWVRSDLDFVSQHLESGTVDFGMNFVGPNLIGLDSGAPAVMLAGGHVGCFELVGPDRVHSIRDLKGKRVGITVLGTAAHVFLSAMAAQVGLDPRRDINWDWTCQLGRVDSVQATDDRFQLPS